MPEKNETERPLTEEMAKKIIDNNLPFFKNLGLTPEGPVIPCKSTSKISNPAVIAQIMANGRK